MNDITEILTETFAGDDRAKKDFERHEAERAQHNASNKSALKYRYFPAERQLPPPYMPSSSTPMMSPEEQKPWDRWLKSHLANERDVIFASLAKGTSKFIKQQIDKQAVDLAELMSRIDEIETTLDALEARIESLEGEGDVGSVKYLDDNLHRTDVGKARFVKVERILKIHREGKRRAR
jgi:hypothetical protein